MSFNSAKNDQSFNYRRRSDSSKENWGPPPQLPPDTPSTRDQGESNDSRGFYNDHTNNNGNNFQSVMEQRQNDEFPAQSPKNLNGCQHPNLRPRRTSIAPCPSQNESSVSNHRRNHSADFSLLTNHLPQLSRRHNEPLDAIDGRLPILPRHRQPRNKLAQEAEELLNDFTVQEFRRQGMEPPGTLQSGFTNPAWSNAGQDLRMLADMFSKSHERDIVRRKAQTVCLRSITRENFFCLCTELFRDGISQERIVVLFTFVSDVAIAHVRDGAARFLKRLMDWSLQYLCTRICSWVQENGGWGVVLSQGFSLVYKCTMLVLAALSIAALGLYIKKSLKDL